MNVSDEKLSKIGTTCNGEDNEQLMLEQWKRFPNLLWSVGWSIVNFVLTSLNLIMQ